MHSQWWKICLLFWIHGLQQTQADTCKEINNISYRRNLEYSSSRNCFICRATSIHQHVTMNQLKQLFTVMHYKNYITQDKHVTAFMLYACLNPTSHAVISILHSKECFNYYIKCNDIWHGKCLYCGSSKSVWSNSQRIRLQTASLNTISSQISKLSDIYIQPFI